MHDAAMTERLSFLIEERGVDEAAVIAEALRTGIDALSREALIEAYLFERIPREKILSELGPAQFVEIEAQRDALRCDVTWGLNVA